MLLKKVIHISLAFLLLLTTAGISISKHYCMGRLQTVAIFGHAESCSDGDAEEPMPCCDNTLEVLKVEEWSLANEAIDLQPALFVLATIQWTDELIEPIVHTNGFQITDTSPPPDRVVLFENLRI